jgi:uncharacterized protein (DUF1330 family)
MGIVNPTPDELARFSCEIPDAKPIVMVNLLRFRDRADYGPEGSRGDTGEQAYLRYSNGVIPLLYEVGGQLLWRGKVRAAVIAPEGEAWDEVVLVSYPSRRAFLRMIESEAYRAILHHRTAALADARLIETRPGRLPHWILRAARAAIRARALISPRVR